MTIKQFFKSNAFKCIAVLMSIVIVCGGIIAICNGLFHVSAEEATNRAMKKIFGEIPQQSQNLILTEKQANSGYGNAEEAYAVTFDGELYLVIKATGLNGFKGGTVTVWAVITVSFMDVTESGEYKSAAATGIGKVIYDGDSAQTLMANFKSSFYAQFTKHNETVAAGEYFTAGMITDNETTQDILQPVSGATYSSTAIINAVNAALFVAYGGESV